MSADGEVPFRMTPLPEDEMPPVAERVAGPATGLIVVAVVAVLTNWIGGMIMSAALRNAVEANQPREQGNTNAERGADVGRSLSNVCPGIVSTGVYSVVLIGGLRMRSLASHSAATTGAWVAMLPLSPAVLVGLPVGIWALRVLGDPEVQQAFHEA